MSNVMSNVAFLQARGAVLTWAMNQQRNRRHAFPNTCGMHEPSYCRRSHMPRALCGKAWAASPLVDDSSAPVCEACKRLEWS